MRCDLFFFFFQWKSPTPPAAIILTDPDILNIYVICMLLLYRYSHAKHWSTRAQEAIMNADQQLWVLSENEHKSIGACGWEETEKINSLPRQAKCVRMLFAHDALMYKRIRSAWKCAGNAPGLTLYSVFQPKKIRKWWTHYAMCDACFM